MDVTLVPAGPDLRDRILGLGPRPEQTRFAGRPTETLPEAEADPQREPVAILEAGEPVGFCVVIADRARTAWRRRRRTSCCAASSSTRPPRAGASRPAR